VRGSDLPDNEYLPADETDAAPPDSEIKQDAPAAEQPDQVADVEARSEQDAPAEGQSQQDSSAEVQSEPNVVAEEQPVQEAQVQRQSEQTITEDAPPVQAAAAEPQTEQATPEEQPEQETGSSASDETAASAFRYDEAYYAPLSADAVTGAEVPFYHFSDMEQALAWPVNDFGRPDPEERPNFRAVRDMAIGFLDGSKEIKATRDVRPMLALAIAEAGDNGPVGLAKALDLFVVTATTYWEQIHPQKEDDDDDELMTRMEEMRKYLTPSIFSLAVESVGIARSPHVGDLTTRTFGIASTKVSPREGEFAPNSDALTALLAEEDEARAGVTEARDAYRHAIGRLQELEGFLEQHPDVDPVDLAGVAEVLEKQVAFIEPFLGETGGGSAD